MITDDLDTDVHGATVDVSGVSNALVGSSVSPGGSRSSSKRGRASPYPTRETEDETKEMPRAGTRLSDEDQERLSSSLITQMKKMMGRFDCRLNTERTLLQHEQSQANQTMVEQLGMMQQDANAMRNENLVLRQDLQKVFMSINDQNRKLQMEAGKIQTLSQIPIKDEYAPEIQMSEPTVQSRRNLLRPEYRTEIPPSCYDAHSCDRSRTSIILSWRNHGRDEYTTNGNRSPGLSPCFWISG